MTATRPTVADYREVLEPLADSGQAGPMAAYMKDQFPYLGIKTPVRRAASKPLNDKFGEATSPQLLEMAHLLLAEPEREFGYVACDLLRTWAKRVEPSELGSLEELIRTKSWWDTVDALAVHSVGALIRRHRDLQPEMDVWIHSEDFWVARTAIIHQLLWKGDIDADRLFAYCDLRAADTEFFIRKALGWALRDYARTDPDAVGLYVAEHESELSGLTKREALKHIS